MLTFNYFNQFYNSNTRDDGKTQTRAEQGEGEASKSDLILSKMNVSANYHYSHMLIMSEYFLTETKSDTTQQRVEALEESLGS